MICSTLSGRHFVGRGSKDENQDALHLAIILSGGPFLEEYEKEEINHKGQGKLGKIFKMHVFNEE